ncbi:MAG: hypothetical protein ACOH5I_00610 [Oligoflexus sp.]
MRSFGLIAALMLAALSIACGKEDKKGKSIGAPLVEPPVTRNMPHGMKGVALWLNQQANLNTPTAVGAFKDFLYPSNGFVGPLERLAIIDQRMASLNSRSEDSEKACISEAAKPYTLAANLPADVSIPLAFQCQESFGAMPGDPDSIAEMAFGIEGTRFSLMERQANGNGDGIVVIATAPTDGTASENISLMYKHSTTSFASMHIKAADGTGVEVTIGDNVASGVPLSCGAHLRANETHVYVEASISSPSGCSEVESYCLTANDLSEADIAVCNEANLSTFTLTSFSPSSLSTSVTAVKTIVDTAIEGFTSFKTDAN